MDDSRLKSLLSRPSSVIAEDGSVVKVTGIQIASSCLELYSRGLARGCVGPPIRITSYFYTMDSSGRRIRDTMFSGEYRQDELMNKDEGGLINRSTYKFSNLFKDGNDPKLGYIKEFLKQGCRNDYTYIPLTIFPLIDVNTPTDGIMSHANGIIIRRSKGTVMRIEPQHSSELDPVLEKSINDGIIKFVNEIGLINPTFVELNEICPQAITKDTNCIFWTMLMFKEILQNIFKKDPNQVIAELSSRPDLPQLIETFKKELVTTIIPSQLNKLGVKRWPDFETQILGHPVIGPAPVLGGKNGKHKSKSRKTKRRNGVNLRKTGKSKQSS